MTSSFITLFIKTVLKDIYNCVYLYTMYIII